MFDLTGKGALVTGASGGIGGGIARALHAQGATVALTGRNAESLANLARDLGERVYVIVADLADTTSIDSLIEEAGQKLDGVDILVNNAGLTRDGLVLRMKDEDWNAVLDVNLTAGFKLARAVLRSMMKSRWGRIINVTSVVGQTGNPGQVNYVASKAGTTGVTKAMAAEVASRNITVNCVAPGFIDTAMTVSLTDDQKERTLEKIPASRFGNPEDVASAVVFLASDEAAYVTGQTLHVNGGMAMI
jgi:3-oxoacyl-[acyl-carrier protein] reductase